MKTILVAIAVVAFFVWLLIDDGIRDDEETPHEL